MTTEEIKAELRICLELQEELYLKVDELTGRYKAVVLAWEELKEPGRPIVDIDGELYQLKRHDFDEDAIESARKHGGFYSMYRLIKIGKPL